MSSVSETMAKRTTLEYMADHYGCELVPPFAANVTVTSLADDIDSITPGALYIPRDGIDANRMEQAVRRGAYAVLVPPSLRSLANTGELPVLVADLTDEQLGVLASDLCGKPANSLAVFALAGGDPAAVGRNVRPLAQLLHTLGNPVSMIGSFGSRSLERRLQLNYPIGILEVQRTLSICQEDGAAAVVIALDDTTLAAGSLNGVAVDVLGVDAMDSDPRNADIGRRARETYGFVSDKQTHVTGRTGESDQIAIQSSANGDLEEIKRLSLAIAMVMEAGVRKNNIKNALRVSHDLG